MTLFYATLSEDDLEKLVDRCLQDITPHPGMNFLNEERVGEYFRRRQTKEHLEDYNRGEKLALQTWCKKGGLMFGKPPEDSVDATVPSKAVAPVVSDSDPDIRVSTMPSPTAPPAGDEESEADSISTPGDDAAETGAAVPKPFRSTAKAVEPALPVILSSTRMVADPTVPQWGNLESSDSDSPTPLPVVPSASRDDGLRPPDDLSNADAVEGWIGRISEQFQPPVPTPVAADPDDPEGAVELAPVGTPSDAMADLNRAIEELTAELTHTRADVAAKTGPTDAEAREREQAARVDELRRRVEAEALRPTPPPMTKVYIVERNIRSLSDELVEHSSRKAAAAPPTESEMESGRSGALRSEIRYFLRQANPHTGFPFTFERVALEMDVSLERVAECLTPEISLHREMLTAEAARRPSPPAATTTTMAPRVEPSERPSTAQWSSVSSVSTPWGRARHMLYEAASLGPIVLVGALVVATAPSLVFGVGPHLPIGPIGVALIGVVLVLASLAGTIGRPLFVARG